VIGTPGGSSIITMVLEGILAFIDGDLPDKITAYPRYHHQYLPDIINAENAAFSAAEVQALEQMGYKFKIAPGSWGYGFMNVVSWDRTSGQMHAASDPRRPSGSGIVK